MPKTTRRYSSNDAEVDCDFCNATGLIPNDNSGTYKVEICELCHGYGVRIKTADGKLLSYGRQKI